MQLTDEYLEQVEKEFGELIKIVYRLRQPDGCPWDRAQTHESIRTNAIEEAYELVEAIDKRDNAKMTEECGDVLLQAVFNGIIAEDLGEYTVLDILRGLNSKLRFRHTHIFGQDKAHSEEDALKFWENNKAKEKGQKSLSDKLDGIATTFPSTMKAEKIQKYAAKVGFDFPSREDAAAKVKEELKEYLEASDDEREMEGGDLMFSVINLLRLDGIFSEVALNRSGAKFTDRVKLMERLATADGKLLKDLTLDEQEEYYQAAKKILNEESQV